MDIPSSFAMMHSTLGDAERMPDDRIYSGARGIAVKILTRIERSDAYLDKLLDYELSGSDLSDADKRLLNELTTGVLRWRGRLDWVLTGFYHGEFSKCLAIVKNAMRVALYQILFLERIPHSAAVNESVEIVKRLKGDRSASVANGVLRSIIRRLNSITYPDPGKDRSYYLAAVLSHPQWMIRRWLAQIGPEETELLMEANNRRPRLHLRVNPLKTTPDELLATLRNEGIEVERSTLLPEFLHADHFSAIARNEAFRRGEFSIQDEGAAMAARLTGVRPGMTVIDLCAAPGGKTTAMAEAMRGEGRIIAVDKYEAKLRLITEAARRIGVDGIVEVTVGDARTIRLDPADVVLLDAPCSGLGVLCKKPDIKWKRAPEDIPALVELQNALMENAARLVKPGGHLIYSTCTIERAENQQVVEEFLERHPEFVLERADTILPAAVVEDEGYMQTFPHRHGVDGMFGARLRRVE